ncbi:hypothetical protein OG426_27665 [Streptomyces canus]|uniref:hypothetical protein n=1 Tax=Streptomyces canus TaxID=58343 RepID=UPI00224E4843|nr:hypothetical protein [Streptomyces canus]MCX4858755.1 hypothetical protein [Streptomyces canus]WSW35961.1 hypothetical protein OG426_27665 [Streptomyces canus]
MNHQHTRGLPVLHPTTTVAAPDPGSPRPHRHAARRAHAAPDEFDGPQRLLALIPAHNEQDRIADAIQGPCGGRPGGPT